MPSLRLQVLLCGVLWTMSTGHVSGTPPLAVQVQMRHVALHIDERTVVNVRRLRGELVSVKAGEPAVFDDKRSFRVRVDSAEISIAVESLSRLMNDYVFNYAGSPLSNLQVSTEGGRLRVKGTLKKGVPLPFTAIAEPRVDADGNLRLHTTSMKALGVIRKGMLDSVGLALDKLVRLKGDRGVWLDGDDFVLKPADLLPPPRMEGRLQAVRVEEGALVQLFGPGRAAPLHPPAPDENYMYYRGGVLRFGKLTMNDADMQLIDQDASDDFDFFQDRYLDQLVAGYSKNTRERGLKVYMADYHRLRRHSGDVKGSPDD